MTSIFAAVNITIGAFFIAVIIIIITNIVKPLEAVGAEMRILERVISQVSLMTDI